MLIINQNIHNLISHSSSRDHSSSPRVPIATTSDTCKSFDLRHNQTEIIKRLYSPKCSHFPHNYIPPYEYPYIYNPHPYFPKAPLQATVYRNTCYSHNGTDTSPRTQPPIPTNIEHLN